MTTWRKLIKYAMDSDDSFESVVSCTLSESELDENFDNGYGGAEGIPFTLWTNYYVYFPTEYDGSEGVGRAARKPNDKPTEHI